MAPYGSGKRHQVCLWFVEAYFAVLQLGLRRAAHRRTKRGPHPSCSLQRQKYLAGLESPLFTSQQFTRTPMWRPASRHIESLAQQWVIIMYQTTAGLQKCNQVLSDPITQSTLWHNLQLSPSWLWWELGARSSFQPCYQRGSDLMCAVCRFHSRENSSAWCY